MQKGTAIADVSAAISQMVADGLSSAVVCVEVDSASASAVCPEGEYFDNATISGGLSIDLYFRGRTCLTSASTSSPTLTFDAAAPSTVSDFHKVLGGSHSAIFVQSSEVTIQGLPASSAVPMSEVSNALGAAISVGYQGLVFSDTTGYSESVVGIKVYGGSSPSDGGQFIGLTDEVYTNETALLVSAYGSVDMHRARIYANAYVGYVLDDAMLSLTDTRVDDNRHPSCYGSYTPVLPAYVASAGSSLHAGGLVVEDGATVEALNDRWLGNCTHSASDLGLVRSHGNSTLVVRNNTFDDNRVPYVLVAGGSAATLWDNILGDDATSYGSPDVEIGIVCGSSAPSIDSNVFWNLDTPISGPCASSNDLFGDPAFTSYVFGPYKRYYHLGPLSVAIDGSSRTIGTSGSIFGAPPFSSASYGTEPNDPDPSTWVADTGAVDIGFHWWSP